MTIRNIVLIAGLTVFLAGCIVVTQPSQSRENNRSTEVVMHSDVPRPIQPRGNDNRVDNGYHDYKSTPSYEGYDYMRVIFITNIPYYVNDDRHVHPIPPHLHDHFRKYPYGRIGSPPFFSRETELRDGYAMSRIVYLNDIPYHVADDRIARPLPNHLHQRFKLMPSNPGNVPIIANRPQLPISGNGDRRNEPPASGSVQGRTVQPAFGHGQDRNVSPAIVLEQGRNGTPAFAREQARMEKPTSEQDQHDSGNSHAPIKPNNQMMSSPDRNVARHPQPMQQERANQQQDLQIAAKTSSSTPPDDGRNRNDVSPQANSNTDKKGADKNKAHEKKDVGTNKKGADEKKPREGKDDNQEDGKDKKP